TTPATPAQTTTPAPKPTLKYEELSPAELALLLQKYDEQQAAKRVEALSDTIAAGLDPATAEEIRKVVNKRKADADTAAANEKAEKAKKDQAEKDAAKAGMTVPTDIPSWEDLKKLVLDAKLVYDRAAGDKDYAASVHVEGTIPNSCLDKI